MKNEILKPYGWIWINRERKIKAHFYETEFEAKNVQRQWGGDVFPVYKKETT